MKKVIDFINKNNICTIATSFQDSPRSSIIECIIIENNIIFATDIKSLKARNLEFNKQISISICNMPIFITLDGIVHPLTKEEKSIYDLRLKKKEPDLAELVENGMIKLQYYKVIPEKIYYNDYSSGMKPTEIINVKQ